MVSDNGDVTEPASEPSPDERLIDQVAAGDADALAQLYDRHAPWLLLRLSGRCADSGLVDELVQDTFLAVWRGAGRYRRGPGNSVGAWIWTIASRRLVDALRARRARPQHGAAAPETAERAQAAPSAEQHVLADYSYGELGTALDRLSPELRAVIRATVIDGLTTRDAAAVLGIPEGTVKTRARRARMQLRDALEAPS